MNLRIARLIVRLYPRSWRARYGQEMLAIVEQSGLRAIDVVDLIQGLAGEWIRASRGVRAVIAVLAAAACSAASTAIAWWLRRQPIAPPTFGWLASPIPSVLFLISLSVVWAAYAFLLMLTSRWGGPMDLTTARAWLDAFPIALAFIFAELLATPPNWQAVRPLGPGPLAHGPRSFGAPPS
jgi:hypothetical protein